MAEEKIIVQLEVNSQQALKNLTISKEAINALGKQKRDLANQEKELTKAIEKNGVATQQQTASLKDVAAQQVQNKLLLTEENLEYRKNEKQIVRNIKINNLKKDSIARLVLEQQRDKESLKLLTGEEIKNTKAGQALNQKVLDQTNKLKDLESGYGVTSRNVGNYGDAVNDVLPLMGGFGSQIQSVKNSLSVMSSAITKTSTAQKGMAASTAVTNKGLKAFRIALISTGIGAIVVALGTLIAAFLSTQRGVDALTKVLRPLEEVFQSLIGFVQKFATKGVDALKKAFKDPKQAILDLGEAIKENLITRVLAVPKLIKAAAKSYINAFKLIGLGIKKVLADVPLIGKLIDKDQLEKDLKTTKEDIKNSLTDLRDASIEFGVGVDAEKVKEVVTKSKEEIEKAFARGQEIDLLTKQIERASVSLDRQKEKGLLIFAQQKKIAEDTTKTTKEQLEAAKKAQEALEKVTSLEIEQQNRKIRLAQLQAEANDTDIEAEKEIQDLIAERERIEAQATEKSIEIRNKQNTIAKQAADKRIKEVKDQEKAEQKAIDDKTKAELKAIDKKIELMKLERQLELATIDETDKEKFEKEKELLNKISNLRLQKVEKEKELEIASIDKRDQEKIEKAKANGEALAQVELENEIKKAELLKEEKLRQDEIKKEEQVVKDEEEAERIRLKEENLNEIKNAAISAGEQFIDQAFQNQNRRVNEGVEREIEALNLKKQAGEITEEEFNKKRLEIDKKAFKDRKRLSQAQNVIDFAVAAGKTYAQAGFIGGSAFLIPLGIQAATQAAIIASQKFEKGGVINGPSHAFGGVNIGNNQEAEGGEAIINKRSTSKHFNLLSAINQDGGGVPFTGASAPNTGTLAKFGNGGIASPTNVTTQTLDLEDLENRISTAVGSIKVQVVASETTAVANRVQQIQDSASF